MTDQRQSVIFLMGPTATGKTDLAIELVQRYPMEIVSVDSAMVYKDMDIGSAKPTTEELQKAPHRLIDICDPAESYSVGSFCEDAMQEIHAIHSNGKTPLLVGGTMMYFHMLKAGFSEMPEADPEIREQLRQQAESLGWPAMHEKLMAVDPAMAAQLHPNDAQRIARALEIYHTSQKSMTDWQAEQHIKPFPFEIIPIILMPFERSILHKRIETRFLKMLSQGFLDEVKQLKQRGDLNLTLPSMRCVGYRQAWEHLDGIYDFDMLKHKGIVATRQLAKRQITWLRKWDQKHWVDFLKPESIFEKKIW